MKLTGKAMATVQPVSIVNGGLETAIGILLQYRLPVGATAR